MRRRYRGCRETGERVLADFRFARGQSVRVKEGSFPLNNSDGYRLIGQVGAVERAWDPRAGRTDEDTVRSEHIQYFELHQYDVRIDGRLYSLNEDWLEEA